MTTIKNDPTLGAVTLLLAFASPAWALDWNFGGPWPAGENEVLKTWAHVDSFEACEQAIRSGTVLEGEVVDIIAEHNSAVMKRLEVTFRVSDELPLARVSCTVVGSQTRELMVEAPGATLEALGLPHSR